MNPTACVLMTPSEPAVARRRIWSSMDSETISSLTDLLSGTSGPKIRATAAAAVAASTSGPENGAVRAAIGKSPKLLRRLLALKADPSSGRLALSALVNLAEDEEAARALISVRAVTASASALLDEDQRALSSLHAALLCNLTRLPEGVEALVGVDGSSDANQSKVAEVALARLFDRAGRIPNVLFLANACTNERGREVLLKQETVRKRKSESSFFSLLADMNSDRRLAAASAFKNCAFASSCHASLLEQSPAIDLCLARVLSPHHLPSPTELANAPKCILDSISDPKSIDSETEPDIKLVLAEALLLLCQSQEGRAVLQQRDSYPVLREWHLIESDDAIKSVIEQVVYRAFLLKEGEDKSEVS